jgi:hypothetical protein
MRSDIERHVKVRTRCIDCATRWSGVVRWVSPESLSKRAPSTTRTSLLFRIIHLRRAASSEFVDCDTSLHLLRSLTAILTSRTAIPDLEGPRTVVAHVATGVRSWHRIQRQCPVNRPLTRCAVTKSSMRPTTTIHAKYTQRAAPTRFRSVIGLRGAAGCSTCWRLPYAVIPKGL